MEDMNFDEKIKELEELEKNIKTFENNVRYKYDYNPEIKTKFESKKKLEEVYEDFISSYWKKIEDLKKEHEKLKYTFKNLKDLKDKNDEIESLFEKIKNWENNAEIILERYKNILRDNEINFALNDIKQIEEQKKQMEYILEKYDDYNKKILEIMGIFLSIFSVIGIGVSSVLKLESNHTATWLMICGTILITMTGLFLLINKKFEIMKMLVIIGGLALLGLGGFIRYKYPEENKELVKQEEFKLAKDNIDNIKNAINIGDSQINNLKDETEKLKSKVEELEKNKSKK